MTTTRRPQRYLKIWDRSPVDANGCRLWVGNFDRFGYPRAGAGQGAHRRAYEIFVGPIPQGLTVDHICFVPACVNPEHLRLMTNMENARRQRSAFKTHCIHGHEFTVANTYHEPARPTKRRCRACTRDRVRRYRQRRRGVAS